MIPKKTVFLIIIIILCGLFLVGGTVTASPDLSITPTPEKTPEIYVASEEELQIAYAEWSGSRHANTFNQGMGANTTCAKCKSPTNWDPNNLAQDSALDCYSCKRIPGEPRPELIGGEGVSQADWQNISCNICHQPVGDSYSVAIAFWDQASKTYISVQNTNELCAKCHEGQHGFEVIKEQEVSPAHNGWACTKCHGAHGAPAACTDCHDPQAVSGAAEHARHPNVNCTACHDAGNLGLWLDENPASRHFSQYIPKRYAHTVTSWPSHNLSKSVDCKRCHHPANREIPVLADEVGCKACHPDGEVIFWCEFLPRDANPNTALIKEP